MSAAAELPAVTWAAEIAECLQDTQSPWGASRFAEWHRCRKAHSLRYTRGLTTLGSRPDYFGIGSLTHAAINFLQRGVIAGETEPRDWRLVVEAAATTQSPEICDEAWRLLDAYFAHWGVENAGWPEGAKILGAELYLQEGSLDDEGPRGAFALPYTARADTVLELPSGEIVIPDTKTRRAGLPKDNRADYARGLSVRPQFTGLSWLVQRHLKLEDPPHIWLNAIVKTKIPQFDRLLVKMSAEGLIAWERDHAHEAAVMKSFDTIEPIANRNACSPDIGSRCEFFEWCHGPHELREKNYGPRR